MIKLFRRIKAVCDLALHKFEDVPVDKVMHDRVSMYLMFVFYVIIRLMCPSLPYPVTTACLVVIAADVIKEVIDDVAGNGADVDDLIADAVGVVKGVVLILVVTCVS